MFAGRKSASAERWGGDRPARSPADAARLHRRLVAAAYAAAGAVIGLVALGAVILDKSQEVFLEEPTQLFPVVPWYTGGVSIIGGVLWGAAGATWLLCAWVLWQRGGSRDVAPLAIAGLFSMWLAVDEFFVLHEIVIPEKTHYPEPAVYMTYVGLTLLYLIVFRDFLYSTRWLLLLLALGFFLASTLMDQSRVSGLVLLEEGLKLFGIVTWALYFASTASDLLTPVRPARSPNAPSLRVPSSDGAPSRPQHDPREA
jgi:hypothetical protein